MFELEINTDNEAFYPDAAHELARILRDIAAKVEHYNGTAGTCRDINGNSVGKWFFSGGEVKSMLVQKSHR